MRTPLALLGWLHLVSLKPAASDSARARTLEPESLEVVWARWVDLSWRNLCCSRRIADVKFNVGTTSDCNAFEDLKTLGQIVAVTIAEVKVGKTMQNLGLVIADCTVFDL